MTKRGWWFVVAGLVLVYAALPSRHPPTPATPPQVAIAPPPVTPAPKVVIPTPDSKAVTKQSPQPVASSLSAPVPDAQARSVDGKPDGRLSYEDKLSLMLGRGLASGRFKADVAALLRKYHEQPGDDGARRLLNVIGGLAQEFKLSGNDILVCVADQKLMTTMGDAAGACAAILVSMK